MERNPLKLYVNMTLADKKIAYSPILASFWGKKPADGVGSLVTSIFKTSSWDKNYFILQDTPENSDLVFIPHNYWFLKKRNPRLLQEFIRDAQRTRKPILIDAYGDCMDPIDIPNSFILRLGQYRFRLKPNDIIVPTYTEDLLESYSGGKLQIRKKSSVPVVGFSGWVSLPFYTYPRTHFKDWIFRAAGLFGDKYKVFRKGVFWRKRSVKILENSSLVKTNFILRSFYSGSAKTIKDDAEKLRKEFVDNIINSDYVLDVKGDANQSIRFYEILSLGRIPLFVDTERVMPLEDLINYRDFCVWVDWRDLEKADKILAEFHRGIGEEKFMELQRRARYIFEHYLRMDSFTKYLVERLRAIASG